jgi:triacylglycerol esterase/lipase EstA (alpha/beta hydrolase family)
VMELFKIRLESAFAAAGGKKVNIVSHSMGGLLVKSFLALHHDVRWIPIVFRTNLKYV